MIWNVDGGEANRGSEKEAGRNNEKEVERREGCVRKTVTILGKAGGRSRRRKRYICV